MLGYTTQAHFLINCGITKFWRRTPPDNVKDYLPLANQLQKLLSPAEMGELIQGCRIRQKYSLRLYRLYQWR